MCVFYEQAAPIPHKLNAGNISIWSSWSDVTRSNAADSVALTAI